MNDPVCAPRTAPGAIARMPSPLTATQIDLGIDDLLATITLTQSYANHESQAIELSYTLALPLDATLLDIEVEIGGRILRGAVQARQQAELRYEQALAEGHSAFAIRMVDDQVLNIALGNLKPGETLKLRIVMAQWLIWNGDRVRLTLPTTIAPRYGNSTLQPVDQPDVDLLAEHGFQLAGRVRGLLAKAELASATHRLAVRAVEQGVDFAIERGQLDRDIVIDLRDATQALRIAGAIGADLPGQDAAMVTFCAHANVASARPVVAELIVDCSGSMGGVSIEQSRAAVRAIVGQLSPTDRVNVLRFGSSHQSLLRRPQPATIPVQRTLLQGADDLRADLGGTELLPALIAGLDDLARVPADIGGERVLFVISDGEVWNLNTANLLKRCAREHVRVFAVAVGSAAVEATFAPLTRATGGALERVLPGDAMAERIQRHFARVRSGALRELAVRWPGATRWTRGPSEVYPGDGVYLSAGLVDAGDTSMAELRWVEPNGEARTAQIELARLSAAENGTPTRLARMLARARLTDIADDATATQLAVDYQLVTEHSAITLVLERAPGEQLDQLPELRVVPQMLAAGWGGTATHNVAQCVEQDAGYASLDIPAFLRHQADDDDSGSPNAPAPQSVPALMSPASPKPIPNPAPKGLFRRALDRAAASLYSAPSPDALESSAVVCGTQAAENALRDEFIRLLVAHLGAHPELINVIRKGELTLSKLNMELPPALFNWLDEQAECRGMDLESTALWRSLIDAWCASNEGARLGHSLSTHMETNPSSD